MCQETLPGTNYDRFWVESMMNKVSTIEKVTELMEALKTIGETNDGNKAEAFQDAVNKMLGIEKTLQDLRE